MTKVTKLRFTIVLLVASISAYALAVASVIGIGLGMSDGGGF